MSQPESQWPYRGSMFDHFAWSVVVVPLLVLAAGHLLVDRLRPDLAVRVFAWTTFAVGVSAALNLASFAVKALAEIPAVAVLGGWSYRVVAADSVHEPWAPSLCSWPSCGIVARSAWRAGWRPRCRVANRSWSRRAGSSTPSRCPAAPRGSCSPR